MGWQLQQRHRFLSTLSLRRATLLVALICCLKSISIHALLAESDDFGTAAAQAIKISIHALLAESDETAQTGPWQPCISIHALLAESDQVLLGSCPWQRISIHALLAESDRPEFSGIARHTYFYPRSPCGERLGPLIFRVQPRNFYPRSPCGERHTHPVTVLVRVIFLSTLSLRRATAWCISRSTPVQAAFLSTLSLRRATTAGDVTAPSATISIHALLAESDCGILLRCVCTLYFYPRSPCGERRCRMLWPAPLKNFYPRSPCGERRAFMFFRDKFIIFLSTLSLRRATSVHCVPISNWRISIHALLAESDEF